MGGKEHSIGNTLKLFATICDAVNAASGDRSLTVLSGYDDGVNSAVFSACVG